LTGLLSAGEHPRVVAAALAALARVAVDLPFKLVKPYLLHKDARVRASALEALLTRDLSGLSDLLSLLLNDAAPRVKALAAVGLWRMGRADLLEQLVLAEDAPTRRSLVWALGLAGRDPRCLGLLERSLDDSDEPTRLVAIRALGMLAHGEDVPGLLAKARTLVGRRSREALARACYKADPTAARTALARMMDEAREGRDPRALSSCLGLARVWPLGDYVPLLPLVEDSDGRVAANAVEVIAPAAATPTVNRTLRVALESPVPRVVANAAAGELPGQCRLGAGSDRRLRGAVASRASAGRPRGARAQGRLRGARADRLSRGRPARRPRDDGAVAAGQASAYT
jgi:HEAT repeat protein